MPYLLYGVEGLPVDDDFLRILEDKPILLRKFDTLFGFIRLLIGLEIYRTARVFHVFEYSCDGLLIPYLRVFPQFCRGRQPVLMEERIKALDKIIQSLYEDKVAGILSEERYLKLSDTYETEQADLTEKAQMLKAEIEKDKKEKDEILDFLCLVEKYSSIEELTPEIIRSFVDRIIVHEKRKENGHYRQEIEIVYNFIGAVEFPDFLDDDEYDGLSC